MISKQDICTINSQNTFEKFSSDKGCIYHGDAIDVLSQIPDESVDLIFVDPPYNIGKNFAGRRISGKLIRNIWIGVISGLIFVLERSNQMVLFI